jgi:hypothetical protein
MPHVLWTRYFLEVQGYHGVEDSLIVYTKTTKAPYCSRRMDNALAARELDISTLDISFVMDRSVPEK